jgi:hypothetical protein
MLRATADLEKFIASLTPEGRAELDALIAPELKKLWLPDPDNGPQLEAYLSEADLLLYGGAAGGGKTDLLIGCALDATEAVIFRRQYKDLQGIEDRLIQITGGKGYNRGPPKVWRGDGQKIELDHLGEPGSELSHQGRPRDFVGFDEGAQLTPYRVKFVMGWLRSASGKRCRAVIATNPPTGGEGVWLIEWFAPWLDPLYPNPASPGELRWCIIVGGQDDIRTVWVDGPGYYTKDGQRWVVDRDGPIDQAYQALSRTYIPARLSDNKYLRDTNYRAQINAMPEPLRSQLLYGDFLAGKQDDPWQVIPSEWVRAAQERWRKNEDKPRGPMLHMGVDVAQGGNDTTVVACLRGIRFDPLDEQPGKDTPTPVEVAGQVLRLRRDEAGITIDHGGGYGGGVSSHLKTHHHIVTYPFVPGAASGGKARNSHLGFKNLRAESWWAFREALDPGNPEAELIELPPDTKLLAQLTAPKWQPKGDKIQIESKEDIRERLGTSTDRADAVIMAWMHRRYSLHRKATAGQNTRQVAPLRNPLARW